MLSFWRFLCSSRKSSLMFTVAFYQPEEVFAAMQFRGKAVLPDGRTFKRNSDRLQLFLIKGMTCVECGIEGGVFVLETQTRGVNPHLNLYAVNAEGEWILMTKDHIIPKSKGGANALENYNTMCSPCNFDKADTL